MSRPLRHLAAAAVVVASLAGCASSDESASVPSVSSGSAVAPAPSGSPSSGPTGSPSAAASPPGSASASASPTPTPEVRRVTGVDASHHQGAVNWTRVAGAGHSFAYLKATEGSTFTDPRFAENAAAAREAGLRVGGYHYFSLCSPGAPQAEHLLAVLDQVRATLPPAVDLELGGQCDDLPDRETLLDEVRSFLDVVERGTGRRAVVYEFPDFAEQYGLAGELDRRRWVRRLGDTPPAGPWWIWQRSDSAAVPGIDGPADLNVMRVSREG